MTSTGKVPTTVGNDSDVHISRENQKKINRFAIRNSWLEELNQELKLKQNEVQNLQDTEGDILMLDDDSITVPIQIGECLVHYTQENAGEAIASLLEKARERIKVIEGLVTDIREEMSTLKSELYSQFGDNINLENEEE